MNYDEKEIDLTPQSDTLLEELSEKRDPFDSEEELDAEEKLITELEGQRIFPTGQWQYWMVAIIAFAWSSYQLYVGVVPVNSVFVRSVHLAFAIVLVYFMYPMQKKPHLRSNITWYDFILATVSAAGALYVYIDYTGLSYRPGLYLQRDIIFAIVSIVLILEASRRALGPALSIIALLFLVYDYFGQYMPDLIAHKGASIAKISGQMYLTTEGIFGVPLGVSSSFVFLFVLFGALLERAGAGEYFINLAYALLGKYRGGPAKASVAASGLTGIISGSSIANTVTTGTFTIPLMKRLGFPKHKAAAVEVAASTNGQLMPPIMGAAAFIIAEFLGLSYTDVVMAAFIPAFVSYFALFYIVHLESLKLGLEGEDPAKLPKKWDSFIRGIHYIIPIFFLVYTLIGLRESATSAAMSGIAFMMMIMVVQKPIFALIKKEKLTKHVFFEGFIDIGHGMVNGAKNMVPIAIATAVAGMVVGSVTLTGIGQVLIEVIEELSNGYIILVLVLTAVTSLILGMGLPTTANYIVMASLTAPVIMTLAFDSGYLIPAIAAHIFVFYFGILADDTPPVGIAAYAAAGIAKSDPIKTGIQGFTYDMRTAILPFMFFFNNELLLIGGVDAIDPDDATKWQWITDPVQIGIIFITAVIGMFAFSSATQSYFITKVNTIERLMFLAIVPLMFLPKIMQPILHLPSHYLSYVIGIAIYIAIYFMQKARIKTSAKA
ncbi:TRAP transporter permease [Sulfurospirillum arcachonense]|uniref:TRAP transporter permease n=1 Tax=Sulfurospirillum arcachonense TaxID=57666 RepID=UPI00046AAD56|nr:TRAP transporter permease [Sulfurospirillum arcachonense]